MGAFEAMIRIADPDAEGNDPNGIVFRHHLTDRAQLEAEVLSGGHLLHLAVAGCYFNDILRAADAREIEITDLRISADGDFEGDPLRSTGVRYSIEIAGDAPDEELRRLVREVEEKAAIPHTLEKGVSVESADLTVRGGGP
ncbi:MAG TPA: OsmC family protein [Solirubrobacterales bacterium]